MMNMSAIYQLETTPLTSHRTTRVVRSDIVSAFRQRMKAESLPNLQEAKRPPDSLRGSRQ